MAPAAESVSVDGWSHIPDALRRQAEQQLRPGERTRAWFVSNVTSDGRFESSLLVLTDRRAFRVSGDGAMIEWPLETVARIRTRDRSGIGTLELMGGDRLLDAARYTLEHGPQALVFIDAFEALSTNAPAVRERDVEPPETEEAEPAPNTKALFRLREFAQPYALVIGLGFMLSLAGTLAGNAAPYLTGQIVRDVIEPFESSRKYGGEDVPFQTSLATWYLGWLVAAAVLSWVLAWAQGALLAWSSERIAAGLRNRSYSHLQKLSLEYFGGKRTGDLMSRISTDSDRICQFLSDSVVDFASDALLVVTTIGVLLWMNWSLALVTLLPFPAIVYLMYKSRDSLQQGFLSSSRASALMTSVLADTIPGIRVVKAFAQEDREIDRFEQANMGVVQANDRVNVVWTFFWPMIAFLNQMAVLVFWGVGLYQVSRQQIQLWELTAFVFYIMRLYGRLEMMSRFVNASQRAAASAQRIFEVLDHKSNVPDPARPVPLDSVQGRIEFRNVGFRYGNRKVIKEISLAIEPGEMIGLVGHTGAGKSTFINLICRFFDVAEGAILVDGHDIRSYRAIDYRRNIGIVLQEPFLFFGTIAENIAYGRPGATRGEIITAARAARAHDFIMQLPEGYDSIVGERGQSLSGGERQRISIARALLIDPKILILDEATSAVDTQTEREIQEALHELVQGRTTIAIAHRLSTLRQANRIVVIDRGRVAEIGRHDELLAIPNGHYAGLVKAQQALTKDIGW